MQWSERKKGWVMVGVFGGLLALIVLAPLAARLMRGTPTADDSEEAIDSIEYQGEQFALTRKYATYEQYKEDENNLAPGQEVRLERAVMGAKVAASYPNRWAMIQAVGSVNFPGYGRTSFGAKPAADGTAFHVTRIEIPRIGKDRVIVFRGPPNGPFALLDDFELSEQVVFSSVGLEKGELVYSNQAEDVILRKKRM